MPNQTSKFRTKYWIEMNEDARGTYNANSEIRFKTSVLKSRLCVYSDAYILLSGTITAPKREITTAPNNRKNIIIENCVSFTDCISEINNTQIDNANDTDIVMPMYDLIEYSDNYSTKTYGRLWQYYRDEPLLDVDGAIADVPVDNKNGA